MYCSIRFYSNFSHIDEIASITGVGDNENGISGSGVQCFASQFGSSDGTYVLTLFIKLVSLRMWLYTVYQKFGYVENLVLAIVYKRSVLFSFSGFSAGSCTKFL